MGQIQDSDLFYAGWRAESGSAEGLTDHSTPDLYGAHPAPIPVVVLPNAGKDAKRLSERARGLCVRSECEPRSGELLLVNKRITGHE